MPQYIDGFVFPISRDHVAVYQRVAEQVAAIYQEHGAIDYLEFVGDDMNRECTLPFPNILDAAEDEIIIFGWAVFDSRESRDAVNKKVEADPRMPDLVEPLMNPESPIFDSKRMAFGGFSPLVRLPDPEAG